MNQQAGLRHAKPTYEKKKPENCNPWDEEFDLLTFWFSLNGFKPTSQEAALITRAEVPSHPYPLYSYGLAQVIQHASFQESYSQVLYFLCHV